MTLQNVDYSNPFWQTAVGNQTMLTCRNSDNGLAFFPGYGTQLKINLVKPDGKAAEYRRLQSHTLALARPGQSKAYLGPDKLSCHLSLDIVSVSYIQETKQLASDLLNAEIVETRRFKNKSDYELWDAADYWYVAEQSISTMLELPYTGAPTNREKNLAAEYATPRRGLLTSLNINLDYRLFRPLELPLPEILQENFNISQITIEGELQKKFKVLLDGQHQWQTNVINTYNTKVFPTVAADPAQVLPNLLMYLTTDVTPYLFS
jgi:hypothetical protein